MRQLYRRRVARGISTVVATVFVIAMILATIGFIIYMTSSISSTMTKISGYLSEKVAKRATGLHVVGINIASTGMNVTVYNAGPSDVFIIRYYVRDVNASLVRTGSVNVLVPVSNTETISIPGTFNETHHYLIALIDEYGNIYRYRYPVEAPTATPVEWSRTLINVTWNPQYPYGEVGIGYSVDTTDNYPSSYSVLVLSLIHI